MAQPYRFRPAFGQVNSLFRGARKDTYPLFTGLLDTYPADLGLSLQLLRSGHLVEDTDSESETFGEVRPFVVRARRSSDNAKRCFVPADFLFGALTAWTGTAAGNDGFCRDWFDQSGNGRHATQTTALSQPRLVKDGVVEVDANGKPTMVFDGVDNFLKTNYTFGTYTSFFIGRGITNSRFYGKGDGAGRHIASGSDTQIIGYYGGSEAVSALGNSEIQHLGYRFFDSTEKLNHRIAYNGGALSSTGVANSGVGLLVDLTIGAEKGANSFGNVEISELIFFAGDQSESRAAIEADIAKRYNITLA